jgi:hypothetical protein
MVPLEAVPAAPGPHHHERGERLKQQPGGAQPQDRERALGARVPAATAAAHTRRTLCPKPEAAGRRATSRSGHGHGSGGYGDTAVGPTDVVADDGQGFVVYGPWPPPAPTPSAGATLTLPYTPENSLGSAPPGVVREAVVGVAAGERRGRGRGRGRRPLCAVGRGR